MSCRGGQIDPWKTQNGCKSVTNDLHWGKMRNEPIDVDAFKLVERSSQTLKGFLKHVKAEKSNMHNAVIERTFSADNSLMLKRKRL